MIKERMLNKPEEIIKAADNSVWIFVVGIIGSIFLLVMDNVTGQIYSVLLIIMTLLAAMIEKRYWNLKYFILYGHKHNKGGSK